MLVLSRKPDEAIYIDEHIKLYVLSIQGKKVKVGIEAPPDVHILRGELCARPAEGNAAVRRLAATCQG